MVRVLLSLRPQVCFASFRGAIRAVHLHNAVRWIAMGELKVGVPGGQRHDMRLEDSLRPTRSATDNDPVRFFHHHQGPSLSSVKINERTGAAHPIRVAKNFRETQTPLLNISPIMRRQIRTSSLGNSFPPRVPPTSTHAHNDLRVLPFGDSPPRRQKICA